MALRVMAAPRHSSTNGPILTMLSNKAKEAIKLGGVLQRFIDVDVA
jgi:hypothetical protein